jgi:flagellin
MISGIVGNVLLNQLTQSSKEVAESFERLSTGLRINSAADDAAGLAIATRLESQERGLAMSERNAQMGISMIQTADSALGSVTEDTQRIRELTVKAANGTLSDADRQAIQEEINALRENVDYTLGSAEFNTKKLFEGHTETFQIGPDSSGQMSVAFPEMSGESLGLGAIDVTTQAGAETAITQAGDALDTVLSARTELGASQNRLESALDYLGGARIDTASALGTIRSANMFEEAMNQTRSMTQLESQLMLLGQLKNLDRGVVSLLLGGDRSNG